MMMTLTVHFRMIFGHRPASEDEERESLESLRVTSDESGNRIAPASHRASHSFFVAPRRMSCDVSTTAARSSTKSSSSEKSGGDVSVAFPLRTTTRSE